MCIHYILFISPWAEELKFGFLLRLCAAVKLGEQMHL